MRTVWRIGLTVLSGVAVGVLALAVQIVSVDLLPPGQRQPVLCSGPEPAAQRVLIVGDSWTFERQLDWPLADTARVCSVSFPGYTGLEIAQALEADTAFSAEPSALQPTDAVVVVGVNDALQHRGASAYAEGVRRIVAYFDGLGAAPKVVELPRVRSDPVLPDAFKAKAAVYACLFDGCRSDVVDLYRAALPAGIALIDYDAFAPGYDAALFDPDGFHLNLAGRDRLGQLIAVAVRAVD